MRQLPGSLAAFALLFVSGAAGAAPYDWLRGGTAEPAQLRVAAADLDLASPAGMRTLERRISEAAHRLCEDGAPVEILLDQRACLREALASGRRLAVGLRAEAERKRALARRD